MKPVVLNLGCGKDIRESNDLFTMVNIDLTLPCDIQADILHLPFKEASVKDILVFNILEHIWELQKLKQEMARVLIPNSDSFVHVLVPHYNSPDAYGDPTHVRFFSDHSFYDYYWPGFLPHKLKKYYPTPPPNYKVIPGVVEGEDQSVWWQALMWRNKKPYDVVCKEYEIEFIKMGCGNSNI